MGCHRLRVVNDLLKSRRNQEGLRVFHELEQFCAWAYLWADRSFELRWLGRTVGFGPLVPRPQARCAFMAWPTTKFEIRMHRCKPIPTSGGEMPDGGRRTMCLSTPPSRLPMLPVTGTAV